MTGREQIAIVRHVPLSTLKKRIKHHQGLPEVVPRLVFIQLRYTGMSVVKAAESIGPRYAGGRPAKLTADQKAALLERLRENDHWTTVEAQQLIQSQFGVTYSLDQVRRILKSFGMHFGKPYPRDYRRPGDAEAQFKKNFRG